MIIIICTFYGLRAYSSSARVSALMFTPAIAIIARVLLKGAVLLDHCVSFADIVWPSASSSVVFNQDCPRRREKEGRAATAVDTRFALQLIIHLVACN